MIQKIISWLSSLFLYVIADPSDNSITINKWLWKDMGGLSLDAAKVFVFYMPRTSEYGFILNPDFKQETQLADMQYNTKYKCIGFESLNPTVNRIAYDYGLPLGTRSKLAVARRRLQDGRKYYVILNPKPHGKHIRK